LSAYVPLYNQVSVERRGLLTTSRAEGFCKWEPGKSGLILHLEESAVGEAASTWRHLETNLPALGVPGPFWLAGFLLAFFPFFFFVHFIVRKVFLLDIYKPSSRPLRAFLSETIDRNLFVVVDAPFVIKTPYEESNLRLSDFRTVAGSPEMKAKLLQPTSEERVLALDNFDYQSDDPKANQEKLSLLEDLLEEKQTLLIFSAVEPSEYSFKNGDPLHKNGDVEESGRWATVMSQFFTEYAEDMGDPQEFSDQVEKARARILAANVAGRSKEELNELIDTLRDECIAKGPLQQVGLQILAQSSFVTLGREHLLNRLANQARPYYEHLWDSCSKSERVTLFHLAKDRLLSHRDPDIERLLRRQLIVRDTDIHLLNDSFRQFVKSKENIAIAAEEEIKAAHTSLWHMLKVPLLVVLVAVTIFLFVTQRDFYTSTLAIVTAVTTLIPAFFKVLTIFHSDPVTRAPEAH